MKLHFSEYETSRAIPNIVVDGPANAATVLTLSHWPGSVTPPGLARDLSAEMVFAYLDSPCAHAEATVVTNNHFDQDGLVAAFALLNPALAQGHRAQLIDIARAGDFGTFMARDAARASMVIAHWYEHGVSYEAALPRVMELVAGVEAFREVWNREDEHLTASERALDSGAVTITEIAAIDLAVVEIHGDEQLGWGHRFAHETFVGMHPMALHNATERFRLLVVSDGHFQYIDRYETWVQYQSRKTWPRVDMRPLATRLSALDTAAWQAGNPADLTPAMQHSDGSSLDRNTVIAIVTDYLTQEEAKNTLR